MNENRNALKRKKAKEKVLKENWNELKRRKAKEKQ